MTNTQNLLLFLISFCAFSIYGNDIRSLYGKNQVSPKTTRENLLVKHATDSFNKALRLESNLSSTSILEATSSVDWREKTIPHFHSLENIVKYPSYHLLNNLCSYQNLNHLHVGLLAGDSFIAAVFGNQFHTNTYYGVDWFQECPLDIFEENCLLNIQPSKFKIINSGCFDVDISIFNSAIDFYFYDADHSLIGHESALTYYNNAFSDVFIVMIDDWNCPWIRLATFKAFELLDYSILYENAIYDLKEDDHGQYLAVIRKPNTISDYKLPQFETPDNIRLTKHKSNVLKKLRNSWCSEEKANLIIDLIYSKQPNTCVEIGVFTGDSFLPIVSTLEFIKQGHAYAIDAWSNAEAVFGIPPENHNYTWWFNVDMEKIYDCFLNKFKPERFHSYFTTIYDTSSNAVNALDQIDFLHIDGNFSEESTLDDVQNYLRKVSPGGYILLSNVFYQIEGKYTKMSAIELLLENCDLVKEVDSSNTILFQKKKR